MFVNRQRGLSEPNIHVTKSVAEYGDKHQVQYKDFVIHPNTHHHIMISSLSGLSCFLKK